MQCKAFVFVSFVNPPYSPLSLSLSKLSRCLTLSTLKLHFDKFHSSDSLFMGSSYYYLLCLRFIWIGINFICIISLLYEIHLRHVLAFLNDSHRQEIKKRASEQKKNLKKKTIKVSALCSCSYVRVVFVHLLLRSGI